MYLIATDVISDLRKGSRANAGVRAFFQTAAQQSLSLYLSVITIGELRQGVERIRHRGDTPQSLRLERWLEGLQADYAQAILPFDQEMAEVWGKLRVPNPENPLDKQIAATALVFDLTVVTRNEAHYIPTAARVLNPFRR